MATADSIAPYAVLPRETPLSRSFRLGGRLMVHVLCVATCFGIFLWKSMPGLAIDVRLSQPMALVYLATNDPAAATGGYFDQMNGHVQNVVYLTYGLLRNWLDHETAAVALHCGIVAALISGVYALALALGGTVSIALATTSILVNSELIGFPCIGANGLPSQATAYCYLFLAIALWGVKYLVEGRPYVFVVLMPLAFLCHMPQGLMAFGILVPAAWLLSGRDARFLTIHVASMSLLVAGFYAYQSLRADVVTAADTQLWFDYLTLLNCGHVFVDYGIGVWCSCFAFGAAMLAGLALCAARRDYRRLLLPTLIAGIAVIGIAQLFIYVWPTRIVWLLMPNRASTLLAALVLIHLVVWLLKLAMERGGPWLAIPVSLALAAAASSGIAGTFVLAACGGAIATVVAPGRGKIVAGLATVGVLVLVDGLGLEADQQWNAFAASGRFGAMGLAAASLAPWVASAGWLSRSRLAMWTAPAVASVLVATSFFVPHYVDYASEPYAPLVRELDEFCALGRWVDAHAPVGSVTLVPPETRMPFFEVIARRGSLLQLSKVAWVYSGPHLLEKFDAVLRDFGIELREYTNHREIWTRPAAAWRSLSATRVRALAKKYGATCVVTYADHHLDLPELRRGEFYVVYGVGDRGR